MSNPQPQQDGQLLGTLQENLVLKGKLLEAAEREMISLRQGKEQAEQELEEIRKKHQEMEGDMRSLVEVQEAAKAKIMDLEARLSDPKTDIMTLAQAITENRAYAERQQSPKGLKIVPYTAKSEVKGMEKEHPKLYTRLSLLVNCRGDRFVIHTSVLLWFEGLMTGDMGVAKFHSSTYNYYAGKDEQVKILYEFLLVCHSREGGAQGGNAQGGNATEIPVDMYAKMYPEVLELAIVREFSLSTERRNQEPVNVRVEIASIVAGFNGVITSESAVDGLMPAEKEDASKGKRMQPKSQLGIQQSGEAFFTYEQWCAVQQQAMQQVQTAQHHQQVFQQPAFQPAFQHSGYQQQGLQSRLRGQKFPRDENTLPQQLPVGMKVCFDTATLPPYTFNKALPTGFDVARGYIRREYEKDELRGKCFTCAREGHTSYTCNGPLVKGRLE